MSEEIDKVKKEILSRLDLRAEFESWGCFKLTGKQSSQGFIPCFSPFKKEKNPSCGININNSSPFAGLLRIFNNSGPRQAIGFFDLAHELSPNHSGKEFIEILKAYADKTGVEFKGKQKENKQKLGSIIAAYDYVDSENKLMYQVCRYEPKGQDKTFRQRRPAPDYTEKNPKWIWNLQGITALPYNIQTVINNDTLYYVEGEGKCGDLIKLGFPGFTFHGGAGKWYEAVLPYFKNKNIILIPDNNAVGKNHVTNFLARNLKGTAKSIKVVELPDLKNEKDDIVEWIAAGGTKAQLLKLCEQSEEVEVGEDAIDELNKKHAVVMVGGKIRILYETINAKNIPDIQFLSIYDFKTLYFNKKIPNSNYNGKQGQSKTIPLADAWLSSSKRREYQEVIFDPQINDNKFFNLYHGLAYNPVEGDWSLYKKHLFQNICNNVLLYYNWLMAWMARIVQYPGGEKPGTAIVLQGLRGVGKGVFVEIFGKIFGHHYQLVTKQSQITGRFNSHLKDCVLLYLDEAFFAGDKSSAGVLKSLITSDHHLVELKGKDAFTVTNHVNCIIASNSDWVVPVGRNERRFFVLNVADACIQNHDYFRAIDKQMCENNGISAMLYDLLTLDITKINLREAPKTVGLLDQLIYNFSSFQKFWFEILLSDFSILGGEQGIQKSVFYEKYITFCLKINERRPLVPTILSKKLVEYSDVETNIRRIISDGTRPRFYIFPDRGQCRKSFEKQIGNKISWKKITKNKIETMISTI